MHKDDNNNNNHIIPSINIKHHTSPGPTAIHAPDCATPGGYLRLLLRTRRMEEGWMGREPAVTNRTQEEEG